MSPICSTLPGLALILAFGPGAGTAAAASLGAETVRAWNRYVKLTERRIERELDSKTRFFAHQFLDAETASECRRALLEGDYCIVPVETRERGGGSIEVPKGRIHHWLGTVFVPNVTLDDVLAWVQDYPSQPRFFDELEEAAILSRNGPSFEVSMRLKRKKVVTVHYQTEHRIVYRRHSPARASSKSVATRIAELENAGEPNERELPPGEDRGFLFRLNSYWRYRELEEGVVIECESLSLSRDIPFTLRWLVAPFVRSVPRESLESTLDGIRRGALHRAVTARRPTPISY